jgi:hypothetical protein
VGLVWGIMQDLILDKLEKSFTRQPLGDSLSSFKSVSLDKSHIVFILNGFLRPYAIITTLATVLIFQHKIHNMCPSKRLSDRGICFEIIKIPFS